MIHGGSIHMKGNLRKFHVMCSAYRNKGYMILAEYSLSSIS